MKRVFIAVVIVLTLLAIPATMFLVVRNQELRKRAAPATTLSLSPASVTKKVGDEFTLEVQIDTAGNQVVAAELHLVYDQTKLEAVTITNGSLFPNVLASGTIDSGTASITVGATSATSPVTGTGAAATVKFKALEATAQPTSVKFASNTFVGALGEGATNVLVGTTPAVITITGGNSPNPLLPTGTPASTPSANLTTSPTTSLEPSISLSPSPTTAASPNAEGTPSAIQILTPGKDDSVTDQKPTVQGKAPPGSTVTITIYSEPITATVTTDASGNWSYTPPVPLDPGPHNIVASAQDPTTGTTKTATTTFVIASAGQGAASESAQLTTGSPSATPVAGNIASTFVLLLLGALFLASGTALRFVWR